MQNWANHLGTHPGILHSFSYEGKTLPLSRRKPGVRRELGRPHPEAGVRNAGEKGAECRFCDITRTDCPDRIEVDYVPEGETDDF